jgi:hypothetical protein
MMVFNVFGIYYAMMRHPDRKQDGFIAKGKSHIEAIQNCMLSYLTSCKVG